MKKQLAVSLFLGLVTPAVPASVASAQTQAQSQPQKLTLTGTVVGRRNAGELWLRSYDRYYRVAGTAPFAVKNGDRIRVAGAWRNGVLSGASWKSVAPLAASFSSNRSVSGEVYRDLPGDEFQVKSLGGAIYRVLALGGKPKTLTREDLVRVLGRVRGGVLFSNQVIITAERSTLTAAPLYKPHRAVVGTVASNSKGNLFELSANGRRDRVVSLYNEDPKLRAGDRVRIWAFWDGEGGLWQASNLRKLSGTTLGIGAAPGVSKSYGPKYRPPTIYGTITALESSKITVRSNNGNSYQTQLLVARPALLTVGSKVRVDGYWNERVMRVTKIADWKG